MWARLTKPELPPDPSASASSGLGTAAPPQKPSSDAGAAAPVDGGAVLSDAGSAALLPVPDYVRVDPASAGSCPAGMVVVDAVHCPYVAHRCRAPVGATVDDGCERFAPELLCEGRPFALHFCIDRFEYPNLLGVRPAIMVEYADAERACRVEGKRLCSAEEWVTACEGPQRWPLPYGLERKADVCNVDRPVRAPDARAFGMPEQISLEIERLDQRAASGSMPGCVSPFGAYDMVGNVAEWIQLSTGKRRALARQRGIAGGGSGSNRPCRFLADADRGQARPFETGFRCCADPLDGKPVRRTMPKGFRLPRKQRIDPAAPTVGQADPR
jgi:sulfatase modifying factor 1